MPVTEQCANNQIGKPEDQFTVVFHGVTITITILVVTFDGLTTGGITVSTEATKDVAEPALLATVTV